MRQSLHRYLVPPAFFILHALLLLPILVPYRPDNSIPESPLQLAWASASYAVPLGCLAFVFVALIRLFLGSWLSPTRESRVEWIILFSIGVAEEITRWALVRHLIKLEGGGGGYGAKHKTANGHGYSNYYSYVISTSIEVEPGIWEGIYLMGWSWSILDCMSTWWLLRPNRPTEPSLAADTDGGNVGSRPQSYHGWRKEHIKRRSADSTIRPIRGLINYGGDQSEGHEQLNKVENTRRSTERNTTVLPSTVSRLDERASSPELSRRSVREEDNDAGDEETSATDNDNDPLDSPLTPTIYRPTYDVAVPTRTSRAMTVDDEDEQEESTPTQQKHNSRFLPSSSITSESDYFGGRGIEWTSSSRVSPPRRMASEPSRRLSILASDSDMDSIASGVQTPLLSSSIPLEQEQAPLLDNSHSRNYGGIAQPSSVLGNLPPPPPDMQMGNSRSCARPAIASHSSYISITTGDEAEDESDFNGKSGTIRAYPSHPAFSSSYIHTHFPTSGVSNSNISQVTTINTSLRFPRPKLANSQSLPLKKSKARKARGYPSIITQDSTSSQSITDTSSRPSINGVDIHSVTFILVASWAIVSALQHIGHGLWFAWFPTLILEKEIQWWSIAFFIGVAFSKGIYVAQSGSGWIISNGMLWLTTIGCIVISFVLYFIVLVLWGVLW